LQRTVVNDPYYIPTYSSYMTGGVNRPGHELASRDIARAQAAAAALRANPIAARNAIYDQWVYEKYGMMGLPALTTDENAPAALTNALTAPNAAEVASGEALNHVLVATIAAEKKGAKAESAYLAPNLLAEVRFSGPPAADAINILRQAGKLNFPAAFDNGPLAEVRPALDRDFAAAAAPVLAGKPADSARVAKLEATLKATRAKLDPLIKDMDFEAATAARRLLNQMDVAVGVLKGPGTAGLIDPRWATEGTSVADLAKFMAKNKLLFGPVTKGNEDAYLALHRALATYLVLLNEHLKPAPKK
jgi:hypothetical protein